MHRPAVFLALVLTFTAAAAMAADTFTVKVPDRVAFSPNSVNPDFVTIEVLKNDKVPDADVKLQVTRVRGDALFYDTMQGGPGTAKDQITLTAPKDSGKAKLSLVAGKETNLEFDVTVVGGTPLARVEGTRITQVTWEGLPVVGSLVECDLNDKTDDCRGTTAFSFYTGLVIDTFAAKEQTQFQKLHGEAEIKQAPIAGIDFQHKIMEFGKDKKGGLWVYGETVHSRRSADVRCGQLSDADKAARPECKDDNGDTQDQFETIIRNSTALEGYAGIRWEPAIAPIIEQGSRLYANLQLGFLTVAGANDIIDNHHVGVGIVKTHGAFTDSFFEAGFGRTDLFKKSSNRRVKFDALLSYNMKWPLQSFIRPFFQITVDSDFGKGSDSVQSFFGFDFDFTQLRVDTRRKAAQ